MAGKDLTDELRKRLSPQTHLQRLEAAVEAGEEVFSVLGTLRDFRDHFDSLMRALKKLGKSKWRRVWTAPDFGALCRVLVLYFDGEEDLEVAGWLVKLLRFSVSPRHAMLLQWEKGELRKTVHILCLLARRHNSRMYFSLLHVFRAIAESTGCPEVLKEVLDMVKMNVFSRNKRKTNAHILGLKVRILERILVSQKAAAQHEILREASQLLFVSTCRLQAARQKPLPGLSDELKQAIRKHLTLDSLLCEEVSAHLQNLAFEDFSKLQQIEAAAERFGLSGLAKRLLESGLRARLLQEAGSLSPETAAGLLESDPEWAVRSVGEPKTKQLIESALTKGLDQQVGLVAYLHKLSAPKENFQLLAHGASVEELGAECAPHAGLFYQTARNFYLATRLGSPREYFEFRKHPDPQRAEFARGHCSCFAALEEDSGVLPGFSGCRQVGGLITDFSNYTDSKLSVYSRFFKKAPVLSSPGQAQIVRGSFGGKQPSRIVWIAQGQHYLINPKTRKVLLKLPPNRLNLARFFESKQDSKLLLPSKAHGLLAVTDSVQEDGSQSQRLFSFKLRKELELCCPRISGHWEEAVCANNRLYVYRRLELQVYSLDTFELIEAVATSISAPSAARNVDEDWNVLAEEKWAMPVLHNLKTNRFVGIDLQSSPCKRFCICEGGRFPAMKADIAGGRLVFGCAASVTEGGIYLVELDIRAALRGI